MIGGLFTKAFQFAVNFLPHFHATKVAAQKRKTLIATHSYFHKRTECLLKLQGVLIISRQSLEAGPIECNSNLNFNTS